MRGEGRKGVFCPSVRVNEQNGTKPYLNWEAFPNIGGEQNGNVVVAGKLKSQERSELESQPDRQRSGFKFSLVGCFFALNWSNRVNPLISRLGICHARFE